MCPLGGSYLSTPGLRGSLPQCPTRASTLMGTEQVPGACRGWAELEPLAVMGLFSPRSSPTRTWPC